MAVASSPRVSRKRLGSNTVVNVPNNNDMNKDDNLLGKELNELTLNFSSFHSHRQFALIFLEIFRVKYK